MELVDEPARTQQGNLPVGQTLQIATEIGFAQSRLGLERDRYGER